MKTLISVSVTRLTNLEFGQHVKTINRNLNLLGGGTLITDADLTAYLASLDAQSTNYDRAMVQIFKSDETIKIEAADFVRDNALSAATRLLSVFELSDVTEEHLAYASLKTLFTTYGNLQSMNFEEESNGIDNLIVDLGNAKYKPHIITLGMSDYITRLELANTAFKTLFDGRTQETSTKEVFDVKQLRSDLKQSYTDMAEYVLSMSKVKNTEEFNQALNVINAVRTYYSNFLARRKPAKKGETPVAIPPMS
jgi:hypothetical protein